MKEFYGYFDPAEEDNREYLADEFAELSRARGGTGVTEGLTVSPAGGLKVSVSPGYGLIDGYVYGLKDDGGAPMEFTLSVAGSADRIDRVVLRLDMSANARSIRMHVLEGSPGVNPLPRELTRNDYVKEISLCQLRVRAAASAIAVEDITDERLDAEVCGMPVPEALQFHSLEERMDARYPGKEALEALALEAVLKTDVVNALDETEEGKVLDARQGRVLEERLSTAEANKAEARTFTATLPVAGWSASAPYTQTVAVAGLIETMTPFADVSLSDTVATAKLELEAWAMVGKLTAGAGNLTAICYEAKPTAALTVRLTSIR